MAPMIWRGQVVIPENIADLLVSEFETQPHVAVGKARTIRGLGRMIARRVDQREAALLGGDEPGRVLVLQSPVEIPKPLYADLVANRCSAEVILRTIAADWLAHHGLPELSKTPNVWANAGIRFGWNRSIGFGDRPAGFQDAVPVLLPGSVFTMSADPDAEKLRYGLMTGLFADPGGKTEPGRLKGFGAAAMHPGTAERFYERGGGHRVAEAQSSSSAMRVVMKLRQKSHLPSPSQIRAVEQLIKPGTRDEKESLQKAIQYLESQCQRIVRIWHDWEDVYSEVNQLLSTSSPRDAQVALKALADIAVTRMQEK